MSETLYCVVECENLEQRSRLCMKMHDCRIHHAINGRVMFFDELPHDKDVDLFAETLAVAAKLSGAKIFFAARMPHPCMNKDRHEVQRELEQQEKDGISSRIKFPLSVLSMIDRAPLPSGVSLYDSDDSVDDTTLGVGRSIEKRIKAIERLTKEESAEKAELLKLLEEAEKQGKCSKPFDTSTSLDELRFFYWQLLYKNKVF